MDAPKRATRDIGQRPAASRDLPLVRAALRRRRADRALEDHVRELVRRWRSAVDGDGSGGDVDPLARA